MVANLYESMQSRGCQECCQYRQGLLTALASIHGVDMDYGVRENIGRHTWAVVLKFFVERTDFTKSLMSTKKQLNIIVNNKQRN